MGLLPLGFSHESSDSTQSWSAGPGTADCPLLGSQTWKKLCAGSNVTNEIDFKIYLPLFSFPVAGVSKTFGERIVIDFQLCDLQRQHKEGIS